MAVQEFKLDPKVLKQLDEVLDKTDTEFNLDPETRRVLEKVLQHGAEAAEPKDVQGAEVEDAPMTLEELKRLGNE